VIYPIKNLIFPHFTIPDGNLQDFLKKLGQLDEKV
jgi:hypothetical protein